MSNAKNVLKFMRLRGKDAHGSGAFGASREHHSHRGIDLVARAGEDVMSPIDGTVTREIRVYGETPEYKGVEIVGRGDWAGWLVKLFYVQGRFCGDVVAGDVVGMAQDISKKYPGITVHVHVEAIKKGSHVDPHELFGRCF